MRRHTTHYWLADIHVSDVCSGPAQHVHMHAIEHMLWYLLAAVFTAARQESTGKFQGEGRGEQLPCP